MDDTEGQAAADEVDIIRAQFRESFLEWVQAHFATLEVLAPDAKPRWCATWWEHPEATTRLKAVWLTYEDARSDPTALSNWWLHQWDPTRAFLFADKGPFRRCDIEHGHLWQKRQDDDIDARPARPPEDWLLPLL